MRWIGRLCAILAIALAAGGAAGSPNPMDVMIDDEGFLLVEWDRFFPIGAYDPPAGWAPGDLARAGFNLLRVRADLASWDEAAASDLRVWHALGETLAWSSKNEKADALTARVLPLIGHRALLFRESVDEPAWTNNDPERARLAPEPLIRGYRALRQIDLLHPVFLNHAPWNPVETLQRYNEACDIVGVDIYPIIPRGIRPQYALTADGRHGNLPNQTPSCVGEFARKMRTVAGPHRPVFVVLQGFAWEGLRKEGDRDPRMIRYPRFEESRFMALDAVINGANGLLYWGLRYVPENHGFPGELTRVTRELREWAPAILGRTIAQRGPEAAGGVELLVRERPDGRRVVFTANTKQESVRAKLADLPVRGGAPRRVETDERIALEGGALSGEYAPLEVRIFEETP